MLLILSEIIEIKTLQNMRESDHFALMFDETTDCSVTEQLAIHGRYIDKESGIMRSCYLKIIDVLQPEVDSVRATEETEIDTCISMCASTITRRVCEFITDAQLDTTKLRGIGTDGASTMIGCRNGVVSRLKETTPSAIGVHCAAHRLNLASSQASDAVPYVKVFSNILRQLFDYFDNSAVRSAGLQAIQALVQEKGKLLAPCSTRWLSTERSVNRLKACFVSVVLSLQREGEERSDAKALGLCRLVSTEYRFVCTMLLLCDALPHVTHLSRCFQITDCDYSIIPRMVASTLSSLEQLKLVDGINLSGLQQFLEQLTSAGIDITKRSNLGEQYFEGSVRKPFLCCLIKNILNRFDDKSVMAAFAVLDPSKLPQLSTRPTREELNAFVQYGNTEIESLARQFGATDEVQEYLEEWASFRQYLRDTCSQSKLSDIIGDLCSTSSLAASVYPKMSKLGKICRVIPIHTADVERTFSQLKLIKTSIRNRVNEKTLDALLRIVREGPSLEEYPISDAVTLWAKKKNRRIST